MSTSSAPQFDAAFQAGLQDLIRWRRDVRRFRTDSLPDGALENLLEIAALSPSVGNAQPWRFVIVDDPARRAAIRADFETCNEEALRGYSGGQAKIYASLKLSGLDDAPVQIAVCCDLSTAQGSGLGRRTMPETLNYSVAGAVQALWLAARAEGVGVGWVSILTPKKVMEALDLPSDWKLIAYLCVGYPIEEHLDPELERSGWETRRPASEFITRR